MCGREVTSSHYFPGRNRPFFLPILIIPAMCLSLCFPSLIFGELIIQIGAALERAWRLKSPFRMFLERKKKRKIKLILFSTVGDPAQCTVVCALFPLQTPAVLLQLRRGLSLTDYTLGGLLGGRLRTGWLNKWSRTSLRLAEDNSVPGSASTCGESTLQHPSHGEGVAGREVRRGGEAPRRRPGADCCPCRDLVRAVCGRTGLS